jgi:hypothetical protein
MVLATVGLVIVEGIYYAGNSGQETRKGLEVNHDEGLTISWKNNICGDMTLYIHMPVDLSAPKVRQQV